MFQQYDGDGQVNMDLRLDSERDLQSNIGTMIDFAELVRKDTDGEQRVIRSKQEGYGYLAQLYTAVQANMKSVKVGMDKLLGMLGTDESACADQAASIFNSCQDVVESALLMAAEAKKVSADLYAIIPEPGLTPLEQMADDGFREVEPDTSESEAQADENEADESASEVE